MNLQPNYPATADPEDSAQLTDGLFSEAPVPHHDKSYVAWTGAELRSGLEIVTDLEELEIVKTIGIDLLGGNLYGISFPDSILYYIGQDAISFQKIEILRKNTHSELGKRPIEHCFAVNIDGREARYVKIVVYARKYLFCDEILVLGS
jgi:hypothetical protein